MNQKSNQSQALGFAGAIVLLLGIAVLEASTGYKASLSLLYALPIGLAVWLCGARAALLLALACSVVPWQADATAGHLLGSPLVQSWEMSVRVAFFFAVAVAGGAFSNQRQTDGARIELLEHARKLEQQIIEVSEHEQQRIGRDLHDGLCQYLAAVACSASSLRRDLEDRQLPQFASVAGELAEMVSNGVMETRNLSHGLMPIEIGHGGLAVALQELADSTTRLARIDCTFDHAGAELAHHDVHATHLFRIAQEAINNAIRHGKAKQIQISLTTNEHAATLSIADNGIGIGNGAATTKGMGISIMKYRANALGGELLIEERKPHGTIVCCTAPAPELEAA